MNNHNFSTLVSMNLLKISSFLLISVMLNACIVHGPRYTTVDKVLKLKTGLTLNEVNSLLVSKPYDLYIFDSLGNKSYIYKYRVTDRKTVPFLLKENNGKEITGRYMDLVAYFTSFDTLYKLESRPTDSEIKEKRVNINNVLTFLTVTVPSVLLVLGITKLN